MTFGIIGSGAFGNALSISLSSTNKKASKFIIKALDAAVANINYNDDTDFGSDELFIKTIFVDSGPTIKRFRPAAMGRATPILKRSSHLTLKLKKTGSK